MNKRKLELGDRNIIGARVTQARLELGMLQKDLLAKLQVEGVEISLPAISLLEGSLAPHPASARANPISMIFCIIFCCLISKFATC